MFPNLAVALVSIKPVDDVIFELVFMYVVLTERTTSNGNTGFMHALGLLTDKWVPRRERTSFSQAPVGTAVR